MDGANSNNIAEKLVFYCSTGFFGMIIIPSLFIMAFTFAICAVVIIGYTLIALFIDLPNVVNIGSTVLTGIPAFITASITGGILLVLTFICQKYLKKYLDYVSTRYHKLHG